MSLPNPDLISLTKNPTLGFSKILKAICLFCSTFPVLITIMWMALDGKHGTVSY